MTEHVLAFVELQLIFEDVLYATEFGDAEIVTVGGVPTVTVYEVQLELRPSLDEVYALNVFAPVLVQLLFCVNVQPEVLYAEV